jgi:hypothetical protein
VIICLGLGILWWVGWDEIAEDGESGAAGRVGSDDHLQLLASESFSDQLAREGCVGDRAEQTPGGIYVHGILQDSIWLTQYHKLHLVWGRSQEYR